MLRRGDYRPTIDRLRTARRVLLGLSAAVLVSGSATLIPTYAAAESVRDNAAPAILEIASARASLMEAHASVVDSFRTGEVVLSGPGTAYVGESSRASQGLANAAELNAAGAPASRAIEVTSTLLSSFDEEVGQADAQNRSGNRVLAYVNLFAASRLLHEDVLNQIDALATLERNALQADADGDGWRWSALVLWGVTTLLLLVVLVAVQVGMSRRFRRTVNPALLAATVATVAVAVAIGVTIGSMVGMHRTATAVDVHQAGMVGGGALEDVASRRLLTKLVRDQCQQACGETVAEAEREEEGPPTTYPTSVDPAQTARTVTDGASAAAQSWGMLIWVPGLMVLVAGLALLALQPRIDEYRFGRR